MNKAIDFILSSLLGDGCIDKNGRLVYDHSLNQDDFLLYKKEKIERFFDVNLNPYVRASRNTKSVALTRVGFRELREKYYPNGRKDLTIVLNDIHDKNLALCLWLCDDAATNKSAIKLCICSCNEYEQNYIIKWFKDNFHVTSYIRFERHGSVTYPFLIFHELESMILFTYLRDFIRNIPSMRHKFRRLEKKFQLKYIKLSNNIPITPRILTIRFRDKLKFSDEEVIEKYNFFNSINKTAKYLNCTQQLLRDILNKHNALHQKGFKKTMIGRGF